MTSSDKPDILTGALVPPPQLAEQGNLKDSDAAQTLSNLSQANFASNPQLAHHLSLAQSQSNPFSHGDPGPSSHPRGPPNLGQLSAVASQSTPMTAPTGNLSREQEQDDGSDGDEDNKDTQHSPPPTIGKRSARSATLGSEEWTRQRKDNHVSLMDKMSPTCTDFYACTIQKEVERRRRGNINEGINELGRIVPNGSGEKAKGAILSRAVQYIHHLKDNEARNIEKWTLEKLLMDQAMGDLQAQLEEMRRLWEEEVLKKQRVEKELEALRGGRGGGNTSHVRSRSPGAGKSDRESEEEAEPRTGKRQRVE
jgi:hypothetical protein